MDESKHDASARLFPSVDVISPTTCAIDIGIGRGPSLGLGFTMDSKSAGECVTTPKPMALFSRVPDSSRAGQRPICQDFEAKSRRAPATIGCEMAAPDGDHFQSPIRDTSKYSLSFRNRRSVGHADAGEYWPCFPWSSDIRCRWRIREPQRTNASKIVSALVVNENQQSTMVGACVDIAKSFPFAPMTLYGAIEVWRLSRFSVSTSMYLRYPLRRPVFCW